MATSIFTISLTLTKTEKGKLSIDPVNQIESVIGLTKEIKLPVSQSSSSLNQPIFSDQYFQRPIRQNLLSTSSLSSSSPQLSCYSGSVCKYADDIEESSIMCSDEDDVTISSNGSKARIYEDVNDSRLEFSEALDAAVRGNRQSSSSSSPSGYRRRERGENIRSNRLGGGYIDTGAEIEGWRERTISTTPEVISKSDLLYSRLTPSNYGSEGLGMFTPCSSTSSSTRTLSRGSIESSLVHRPVSSASELESGWGSQEAIESTIDDRPYMIHTRDRGMLTNYDSDERSDYSRNLTSILIGMEDNRSNRSSRISRVFGDIEEAELEVEPSSLGSSSMNSLITTNTNSNNNNNNSSNQRIENTIEGGNEDEGEGEGGNDFDGASRRCDDNMEDDGKDEKNVKSIKVQRYLSDSRESNQDDRDEELEQIEKNEPQVSRMERNEYAQGLSIRRREKDCDYPEIDRLADREKSSNFDEEKKIRVLSARRIIVQEEKEKKKEDDDEESERDKVENDGEKHDKDGKSKRDEREHERVGEKKEIKNEKDHEDEDEKDEQDENEGGIDQVLSKSPSKFVSMSTTDSTPAMEPEYSSSLSSMNSKRLANILLYPQEKENNNTTDKKKESVKYTTTSTLSTTSLSHSPSIPPSSPPSAPSLSPSPSSCSLIPTSTLRPRRGRSAGGERRSCSDPFGSIINNNPHSLSSSVRDHFKSRASITVPYSGITISRGLVSGYLRPSVVNLCGDYGGDIQGIEGESKCNENEEKQNRTKPTADDNNNEKSSDFSKCILKSLKESSKLPKCQQSSSSSSNPTTSSSNVTTSSTSTSIKPTNLSARSIRIARQKLDPDSLLSLLRPQQNDNRPSSPPPPPPPPPPQPFPVILPYSNSSSLSTSPLPPPPTSPLPLPLPPSNSSLPTLQSSSLPETLSSVSMVRSIVPQTITMFPVSCTTQTRDSYTSPQVCSIGLRQDNCSISTNTEIDMELMNRILDKILAPKVSISIQTEDQSSKPIKVRKCRDASVGTEKFSRERFSALPETRSKHTQTECSWLRNKSKAVSTQDDDSSLPITLQSSSPTESRPFRGIVRIVRDRPYKLTKNINIQTDLPIRREMILSDRKSRKLSSYNDNRKIVKIDDEDLEEEKEIFVDTETEKDEDEDDEDGDDSYFEEKDEIQREEEEEDGDNLDSVSSQSKLTKQVNQSTQISSSFPSSSSYSLTRSPTFDIINNTIKRRPKVNTAEKVKISKKQKSVQTEPLTMIRGIELPLPGTETRSVSRATSPTTNTIDDNYSISRCSSRQLMISPEHRVRPIRESNINQNKPQSSLTRSNVEQINNQRSSINNIVNYGNTIRSESNRSRPLRSPSLSPSRSPSRSSNQLYRITSQNPVMIKQQQSNEKLSSQFEPHQQPSIQQQHNYYNHQHQQQQNQHRQTEQTPIHQQAIINNNYHQQRYSNDPILQQQQQSHQPFSGMAQPQTIDQQSVPIQSIPVQAPVQVHTPTPAPIPIPIPVSVSVPNSALGSTSETKTPTSGIVNKDISGNQTTDLIIRPYPSQPNESLIKSFGQQLQTHSKVIVSINKPSQREVSEVSSITTMDRNGKLSRKTQVSTSRKVPVFTGLNSVRNHEDDQETQSTVTQPVITSPTLSKATFPSTTVSPLGKKYFQPTATTTTISASSTRPSSALENLDQNFDNNHNTKIQQDDNYYIQSIDDDIESNIFSPPPPISPLASHPSHHSIQPIQPIPRQSIPLSSSSSINRVTDPLHILINEPEQQHDNQPDDIALPSPAQSSSSSSSLSSTPLEIHYPQSTAQTGYHKQLLPPHSTDQHTDQSQSHQDQHQDQHERSTSSNRLVQTSNSTNPILVTAANRRGIKGPIIGITWEEASSSTICSEMSTEPFKDSAGTLHRPKSVSLSSETVIGSTGKDTKVETRSRTSRRYADNCIIEPDIKSETIVTDSPPFPITNTCSESNNRNVLPSNSEDSHRPPLPPTTNQPSDQNESSKPPTQLPTSPSKKSNEPTDRHQQDHHRQEQEQQPQPQPQPQSQHQRRRHLSSKSVNYEKVINHQRNDDNVDGGQGRQRGDGRRLGSGQHSLSTTNLLHGLSYPPAPPSYTTSSPINQQPLGFYHPNYTETHLPNLPNFRDDMNLRNLRSISLSDSLNDKHKRSPMLITSPQPSVDSGLKVDEGSSVDYDQSRSNFESRESVLRDTDSRSISRVNSSHEYDAGKVKESKMREEAIRTLAQSRQQSSMVPKGSNEFRKSQQSLEPRSIEKQQQQQVDERKIQEERSKSQGETEITTSITKTKIPQETESDGMGGIRIKRPAMSRLVLEQQLQSTDRGKVGMGEIEGGGRRIGDREGREGVNPSMGVGDGCTISSSITLESPYEYKKRQKENANQKMVSMKDLTFGKKENESIGMKSANSMDSIPKKRTKSCHSYTLGGSTPGIGSIGRQGEEDEDGRGGEVITTSKFERHKSPQDSRGREKTTWEYSMECNCVNGVNTSLRTSVKHKRTYLPFACTMYESSV